MHLHSWLIALEGIDGAGTTTQVPQLARHLRGQGRPVLTCAQPSPGPLGVTLRRVLRGEMALAPAALALLFAADRLAQLQDEILPFLAAAGGGVAICDRYVLSSLAYQGIALPGAWVAEINRHARAADLTCFFRVGQATAAERRARRGGPVEAFDAPAVQAQVAAAYEAALITLPEQRRVVIDAEADEAAVFGQLAAAVDGHLARQGGARAS